MFDDKYIYINPSKPIIDSRYPKETGTSKVAGPEMGRFAQGADGASVTMKPGNVYCRGCWETKTPTLVHIINLYDIDNVTGLHA